MSKNQDSSFLSTVKKYRKEIFVALLSILIIIFLVQNSQDVKFSLVFWKMYVPLILLLIIWLLMGALLVWVFLFFKNKELRKEVKQLKKQMSEMGSPSTFQAPPQTTTELPAAEEGSDDTEE